MLLTQTLHFSFGWHHKLEIKINQARYQEENCRPLQLVYHRVQFLDAWRCHIHLFRYTQINSMEMISHITTQKGDGFCVPEVDVLSWKNVCNNYELKAKAIVKLLMKNYGEFKYLQWNYPLEMSWVSKIKRHCFGSNLKNQTKKTDYSLQTHFLFGNIVCCSWPKTCSWKAMSRKMYITCDWRWWWKLILKYCYLM